MMAEMTAHAENRAGVWLAAGLIVAAGLAAYQGTWSVPLVFDDHPAIAENPTIRSLWPPTQALQPPANTGVGGRPLANLSFALNYAWSGTETWSYHGVNLALHLGAALLLFGCVRRTWVCVSAARSSAAQEGTGVALAAALLWVLHPVNTIAVTYLSQRTEVLMGFFYVAMVYAFLRSWWWMTTAACAAGMLSKEVMVTAPVFLLLFDRTFVAGSFAEAWRRRKGFYLALASTWVLLAWAMSSGLHLRSVGFGLGVSPLEYAASSARAVLLYLQLAVWPAPLVFDYGRNYAVEVSAILATAVLVGGAMFLTWRRPKVGFFAVAFLLLLAPTTSVVPVADQPVAENRMYLPLAVLMVGGVAGARAVAGGRRCILIATLLAGALGLLCVTRNAVFASPQRLWRDTIAKRPENARAHFNYGVVAMRAGDLANAIPALRRALALKPPPAEEAAARNALGNALLRSGDSDGARQEYLEAIRVQPHDATGWYHWGLVRLAARDLDEARRGFEQATRLDPRHATAFNSLGNLELQLDQPAAALRHYRTALALAPQLVEAHYNAGSACFELERFAEAVAHFTSAVTLSPRDAELRNYLGAALLRAGKREEAVREFREALRLEPANAAAAENLNTALSAGTGAR